MPINYCLEDDSLYYFENISNVWLEDLGLFQTSNSYIMFAERVLKFHVLGVALDLIVSKPFVTVFDVYKNLNNDFIKRKLNLPAVTVSVCPIPVLVTLTLVQNYLEPIAPYDTTKLNSYILSNFWDVFCIYGDKLEVRSEISKPNKESLKKFQDKVVAELKEQDKRIPKNLESMKNVRLGEPMNTCIEAIVTLQNDMAKQYVNEFFEAFGKPSSFVPQTQRKTSRVYDPKHYQLKYMKSQHAFRKEDWQRPYGFDDDVVQRLMNGEDVQIKNAPSFLKVGENTGTIVKKPFPTASNFPMKTAKKCYSQSK